MTNPLERSGRFDRLARAAAALFLAGSTLIATGCSGGRGAGADERAVDRAAVAGFLLDVPRRPEVVDEALRVADGLRRHYGIDTGHRHADRLAAAERARVEVLERLSFSPEQLRTAALELGYDLDPARCRNFCRNVENLARIELQRRALRELARG